MSTHPAMRVPGHIYCREELLDAIRHDRALEQLINVASLPGIQRAAIVMPDAHEGYGFPIGGVAATRWPEGFISPGGIGYDINCGVRLLLTPLVFRDVENRVEAFSKDLYSSVPSGTGKGGDVRLNLNEMNAVLRQGATWAVSHQLGEQEDLEFIESNGCLANADPDKVSEQDKRRGLDQLGTIGSGNHFVEMDRISAIFNDKAAAAFGLSRDQIVMLIHTGSRGLGHQVATDYLRLMVNVMDHYDFKPRDRELAGVPFNSPEGQAYFNAMAAAANFAWCNREIISHKIRQSLQRVFHLKPGQVKLLYDVAHNIAKVEEHPVAGVLTKLIVHRKGATRAFGPGHLDIPEKYRAIGQPVLIPGSMGTSSFVLAGAPNSMDLAFGSTCHGAGRKLSRTAAKKQVGGPELKEALRKEGIYIQAGSFGGIAEEAPLAYKDVDLVVDTVHEAGLAIKVARLKPLAVIKG
jgi:tRNA-splicing ligase RtcB